MSQYSRRQTLDSLTAMAESVRQTPPPTDAVIASDLVESKRRAKRLAIPSRAERAATVARIGKELQRRRTQAAATAACTNPLDHLDPDLHEHEVADIIHEQAHAEAYADLLASVDDEVTR